MKRIIISEAQHRMLMKEYAQDGFSLEKLDSFKNEVEMYEYCEKYLGEPVGRGSSRFVFDIDEGKVLKLTNNKYLGQRENMREWSMYEHYKASASRFGKEIFGDVLDLFPKCYEHGKHYLWIVVESVLPIHEADFMKVLGIPWKTEKDKNSSYNFQQHQPTYNYEKSSLWAKAYMYAKDKAEKIGGNIKDYKNEFYARYGMTPQQDISRLNMTYDEYDDADIDKHNVHISIMKELEPQLKNFKPSMIGFLEWMLEQKAYRNSDDEYERTADLYYSTLVHTNPWFKAFHYYGGAGYEGVYNDPEKWNRDFIYDNFGLALRNGKPWIVLLDSGKDNDEFTPYEARAFAQKGEGELKMERY